MLKIHEKFKEWEASTAGYPIPMRLTSINGVEQLLLQFVSRIAGRSADTNRRLRGLKEEESVTHYNPGGNMSKAATEVHRLARAHRALLDQQIKSEAAVVIIPRRQKIETFLSNHKGILSLIGICVAIIGLLLRGLGIL
jgi:hypothetical protein